MATPSAGRSALWEQVARLTSNREVFKSAAGQQVKAVSIDRVLAGDGVELVGLADVVTTGGVLSYQGRQILLYIPDHGSRAAEVISGLAEGNKFHVSECQTLADMRRKGRLERYIATANLSGEFKVAGTNLDRSAARGTARLYVCKQCLKKLNYRSAARSSAVRARVRNEFDIGQFFETYSSCFVFTPRGRDVDIGHGSYSADWPEISRRTRERANWTCQEQDCGIQLRDVPRLLHVHHVDGNKHNNDGKNLEVLCADCHRRKPHHGSMFVKREDVELICLRRRQLGRLMLSEWARVFRYADPALHGALDAARARGLPIPELGVELPCIDGTYTVGAAWPKKRVAVAVPPFPGVPLPGWAVLDIDKAVAMWA